MDNENVRKMMNESPAGKFLANMGMEYYNTESAARRVAEKAVEEIEKLKTQLEEQRSLVKLYSQRC